jgi:hypothetical protein
MIKFWISATNPKMPSDKKPARKKLRNSSKPESKFMFVIRELYTQQSGDQIKSINITHFVRNRHDAGQGRPWRRTRPTTLSGCGGYACALRAAAPVHLALERHSLRCARQCATCNPHSAQDQRHSFSSCKWLPACHMETAESIQW